jgi:inward rectifier potassium channel
MSEEGLGEELAEAPRATYPRLGTMRLPYIGLPRDGWRDAYHYLLTMPIGAFIAVMATAYLAINALFGFLYWLDPGGLAGARPGNFADAFFFSVETFGTIGYGAVAPKSLYCNLIMTVEAFIGLFNLAIATGLLFARISRPTARIMFSRIAVISPLDGVPTLSFRAANRRRNLVVEAEVSVTLVRDVLVAGQGLMRRFYDLPVVRSRSPLFFMTWQVMHPVTESSPLYGETQASLLAAQAEILVVMKGIDETFVSTIHARTSYRPDELVWGRGLADIFTADEHGRRAIDFRRFHDVV